MARKHFPAAVRQALILRAGGRCSNPSCGRATLGPSSTLSGKGQVLGEAAHIRAASPAGARYDQAQSDADRHSAENGLWLCERCASMIDKNDGADFSVEQLSTWKLASERAANDRLQQASDMVRANCVETLIFINIPRLHHFIALSQQDVRLPTMFDDGIPGDGYIAPQLHALERAIGRLRFPALDWREIAGLVRNPLGMMVSFEGQFRTRNGPNSRKDRRPRDFGDLTVAPHIYQKAGSRRLVLPYDPRFVTTSTAGMELTSGQTRVGGFAQVKKVDGDDIIASPLLIGLASTPEGRAFRDALISYQRGTLG